MFFDFNFKVVNFRFPLAFVLVNVKIGKGKQKFADIPEQKSLFLSSSTSFFPVHKYQRRKGKALENVNFSLVSSSIAKLFP
jgi:hypothetical protein